MNNGLSWPHKILNYTRAVDFLSLLAIRIYLIPILWMGGTSKYNNIEATVKWFGDPAELGGLSLPFPTLMTYLAMTTELLGVLLLLLGLATRWIALPLMITMGAAGIMVHIEKGWLVIANNKMESTQRLNEFMEWLSQTFPGRYNYLTELADPVMLNNGVEFAVTFLIMLSVLFFFGGGRYVSCDYWIAKRWPQLISRT